MIVETFAAGGKHAQRVTATRFVVYDDHGNPIVLAVEHGPGQVFAAHLNDPEFEQLLDAFGVEMAVVARVRAVPGD
jgi:hypothetical protein